MCAQAADHTESTLELDAADQASAWNKLFPERAWDTAPELWSVLESVTAEERGLLDALLGVCGRAGKDAMDVSIAKV